jgi:sugar-specific transcriptional regulator TrmB
MIEEALRSIGLSKNEIKIYLALLELGPSLMGGICGKTKIHRRNVYDSIEMLKDKGFVSSTVINNRNVFEAVNPKRILDILDEKKTDIQSILPQLLSNQNKKQSLVRVYTGLNGRKVIFEDKLNYKEEQYVLGAHEPSKRRSLFIENYHKRRIMKKIPLKMLFINNAKDAAKKFSKYKFVQARLLPNKLSSPIAINIYGNKTAILLGSQTLEPITILIEDKGLAEDFKTYFKMLWNISKQI